MRICLWACYPLNFHFDHVIYLYVVGRIGIKCVAVKGPGGGEGNYCVLIEGELFRDRTNSVCIGN